MGGSGGGGGSSYSGRDANLLRQEIHRELAEQELDAAVNAALSDLLANINNRDVDAVRRRLDEVLDALGDLAFDVDRLLYGGSVAKHTYVDGLSDTDALVVLRDADVAPSELVSRFADVLRGRLSGADVLEVSEGRLAVTVTYRDGTEIQLLPAVERGGRTSIASGDGREWRQIRPHKFAEKLTEVNKRNGSAVIPTIKLAKSLLQNLPEGQRLSGYHVEAIAVDAFKNYPGRRDRRSMLGHLLEHASDAILRPTGDITGQSVHIDQWLGAANSSQRQAVRASISRIAARLSQATDARQVRELFDV